MLSNSLTNTDLLLFSQFQLKFEQLTTQTLTSFVFVSPLLTKFRIASSISQTIQVKLVNQWFLFLIFESINLNRLTLLTNQLVIERRHRLYLYVFLIQILTLLSVAPTVALSTNGVTVRCEVLQLSQLVINSRFCSFNTFARVFGSLLLMWRACCLFL